MRKLENVQFHRNGVGGEPFYVVTFTENRHNMMAVIFDSTDQPANPRVAVFDRDALAEGNITFGENSWRGDTYAAWLEDAINKHTA